LNENEEIFTNFLVNELIKKYSGQLDDILVIDEQPMNIFFLGTLNPIDDMTKSGYLSDLMKKIKPSSIGIEFLIESEAPDNHKIIICPKFSVFYRIFPPYDNLREYLKKSDLLENDIIKIPKSYKRIDFKDIKFEFKFSRDINTSHQEYDLSDVFNAKLKEIIKDDLIYHSDIPNDEISRDDFISEESYNKFIKENKKKIEYPSWDASIDLNVKKLDKNQFLIKVLLNNEKVTEFRQRNDSSIFNPNLEISIENLNFIPIEYDIAPEDYHFKQKIWGYGHNCSVHYDSSEARVIRTEICPIFFQKYFVSKKILEIKFRDLSENPIPILKTLEIKMKDYSLEWERSIKNSKKLEIRTYQEKDLKNFKNEIERFSQGIWLLEEYPDILKAFKLMNYTFFRFSKNKNYDSWHLFQIVFIVSNLYDIACQEYKELHNNNLDIVEIIWYPTGGGKTEAYLGLILFNAFFDRIRGKFFGVTCWMRYPLRLLSLQQLQRILNLFIYANIVLKEDNFLKDVPGFSLGYYVGARNIPNKFVDKYQGINLIETLEKSEDERKKLQVIFECPICQKQSIITEIDSKKIRFFHKCKICSLVLPLHIIDTEIYRILPTMIIGTLDKIAVFGSQKNFVNLFGGSSYKCPLHGFSPYNECIEKELCTNTLEKIDRKRNKGPTLLIQDEIHLVKESLGTLDSHYETMLRNFQFELTGLKPKIIAATATIAEYEHQIDHLYLLKARRFPAPGPKFRESFYAEVKKQNQRIFIGVMPHNFTPINALIEILKFFQKEIQKAEDDPVSYFKYISNVTGLPFKNLDSKELLLDFLSEYRTSLIYLLSKQEGNTLGQSLPGQVYHPLEREGFKRFRNEMLTGDSDFSDIADIINLIDSPPENFEDQIRSLEATSIISHGIDLSKLNCMIFFGMPKLISEYIQSSSRVGREHVGIVFTVFTPTRERDQSFFKFFNSYHQLLERLVEPVPINRWAKNSHLKTLPGIIQGLLINLYSKKLVPPYRYLYYISEIKKAISSNDLKLDEFKKLIINAYLKDFNYPSFKEDLETLFDQIMISIRNKSKGFIFKQIYPSPMNSLRDISPGIDILADYTSQQFLSKL